MPSHLAKSECKEIHLYLCSMNIPICQTELRVLIYDTNFKIRIYALPETPSLALDKETRKIFAPPIDEALQARFDEGHAFEPFVEALYPSLIRLGFNSYSEYLEMPDKTAEAWDYGAEVVSQGRYESGSITCISDIVRRMGMHSY